MIVKVVVPDSIYAQVYFARGAQGPTGATGATGVQGPTGATGAAGTNGSNGVGYTGVTSTSSITIGSGLKTWTVANVGAFLPGMRIRAIHSDTPSYWMEGPANVATGTTIIITVDKFNGSGSHNNWLFAVAGEIGATGSTGDTGATGSSGVVSVTAPITNTGTSSSAIIGIDQTGLTLAQSQITGLVAALADDVKLTSANALTVGGHTITNNAIGTVPFSIIGISGQTANAFTIQTSAFALRHRFTDSGRIYSSQSGTFGSTSDNSGTLAVLATSATTIGAVIRAAASATANIQEWQNSAGTVLASVSSAGVWSFASGLSTISSSGAVRAIQINTNSDLFRAAEANSGGFIRLTKGTAALTNQGANIGAIYFRDGTTTGTLKLVVRAGAAGAETTILDNIPQ